MFVVFNEQLLAKKVSGYRKFALLLTVIITVVMAYFGVRAYFDAKALLSDHSIAQAQITHTEHRQEQGKKGFLKDIYEVSYEFNVNNRAYLASFITNENKFADYHEGEHLNRYFGIDWHDARLEELPQRPVRAVPWMQRISGVQNNS